MQASYELRRAESSYEAPPDAREEAVSRLVRHHTNVTKANVLRNKEVRPARRRPSQVTPVEAAGTGIAQVHPLTWNEHELGMSLGFEPLDLRFRFPPPI